MPKDRTTPVLRTAAAILAVLATGLLSCAAGGRGIPRRAVADQAASMADSSQEALEAPGYIESEAESGVTGKAEESDAVAADSLAEWPGAPSVTIQGQDENEQDPFSFIPNGFPEDIALHPDAKVAGGGRNVDNEMYVFMLASSKLVTPGGVQDFHLEELATWESLRVREIPAGGGRGSDPILVIVAEKPGARLEISTARAAPGLVEGLRQKEYWLEAVGSDPVWIRLSYSPMATDE